MKVEHKALTCSVERRSAWSELLIGLGRGVLFGAALATAVVLLVVTGNWLY